MKAKISYFTGLISILSGLLMGTAGVIWATHLTTDYTVSLLLNQIDSLDAGKQS